MRRPVVLVLASLAFPAVVGACGSRTGLIVDETATSNADAGRDGDALADVDADRTIQDAKDARETDTHGDAPLFEGGKLDVVTDCEQPSYCDPRDLGFIYKCGVRIEQCGSLEQCVMIGGTDAGAGADAGGDAGVAECVNPCLDTLGQD